LSPFCASRCDSRSFLRLVGLVGEVNLHTGGLGGRGLAERTEVETLRVGLLLDGHGAMEGPRTTDHGGNDERAAGHHRGYPLFETDYQLLEEIGHGANGNSIVFRAICLPNNEVVAIKCLDPATSHRTLDQVRAEATAMSLISHPNVLRAYCSFVAKNSLWVVMPYMAGGSCVHIMKAAFPDGFEEPVIATILKETLKALNYLHQHGHIHRDVKAQNILIDENGVVKLGDLGISASIPDMGDLRQPRSDFEGTRYWCAVFTSHPCG